MIVGRAIRRILRRLLGESRAQYLMNKWLMLFWMANLVLVHVVFFFANALWQKASILYLADLSVYACIGQHYTGVAASQAGMNTSPEDTSGEEPPQAA